MNNKEAEYEKLIEYNRNGLNEQVHFGIILHMNKNGIIKKLGDHNNYKFYHRSCMKPLQVSPIIDLELDKKYNLSLEEIAVCCASHTGDLIHQEHIKSILNKIGYKEDNLLCPAHSPLSKDEQKKLILANINPTKIHNNCSGKHSAMLAICKEMNFPISNYKDLENPLSDYIIQKVCNLCEVTKEEIIISKDGCGLPVIATTLESLGRGFINLFTDKKYNKITQAFLNYPYLIGGKNRQDSEIINASTNLIAKVGACGLCVVVNIEKEECLVVKIADSNMEARSIATIEALLQLKWLDIIPSSQINNIYKRKIVSQDNEVLGFINSCFCMN